MFFGILFAMCACQDSHEPFAMDANVTCVDNESVAIDNLIKIGRASCREIVSAVV